MLYLFLAINSNEATKDKNRLFDCFCLFLRHSLSTRHYDGYIMIASGFYAQVKSVLTNICSNANRHQNNSNQIVLHWQGLPLLRK